MIGWLSLTDEQRGITLEQAAVRSGITTKALEKDWWVSLVLKALFETAYSSYFVFKGGTSLSKGYKLIHRFSEDIDIALSPEAFGRKYKSNPSHSYVKRLKKEGCLFTSTLLKDALIESLRVAGIKTDTLVITADQVNQGQPDKDPQTLYVQYRSLYPPHAYLKDEVKIEFSVRSLVEPHENVPVQSLLWEYFPNKAYEEIPAIIRTTLPAKTFLEKIFLLHEKFPRLGKLESRKELLTVERGSRHLYDVIKMEENGIADVVMANPELYTTLVLHRRHWMRLKEVDYNSLHPATLSFVPPQNTLEKYRADYTVMLKEMIYVPYHDFEILLEKLQDLNKRFRNMQLPLLIVS
jgi:Nucleotidyl transferase AbiEii toxin, Type IV TA system